MKHKAWPAHQNKLLQWAQKWNYPYLPMPDGKPIRHGLAAWKRFVGARNQKRTLLAWGQIARWNAWVARGEQEQERAAS